MSKVIINSKNSDFSLKISECNVCGQNHDINQCSYLCNLHYVLDSPVLSKARQTIPQNLTIIKMADNSNTIIAKNDFQKGTTFGPLCGKKMWTMNPETNFPIRIFGKNTTETYHLDCSNENESNWMHFIAPAYNIKEQNLICYQVKDDIFYTAIRTIYSGEELKVWYAPYYAIKMQMPLHNIDIVKSNLSKTENHNIIKKKSGNSAILNKDTALELAKKLPAQKLGARTDKATWTCKECSSIIHSVVAYARHLMEHYKPLIGAICNICNKKFNNVSLLEKHKNIKHLQQICNNENNAIIKTNDLDQNILCAKSISSSELLNCMLGSVKYENLKTEEHINSDQLPFLKEKEISNNIVLVKKTQNDEEIKILKIKDSKSNATENLQCDICEKEFDKAEYLYRHLRKHTGEFICPSCLVVFARKENLLSHNCFAQKSDYHYECPYCQKLFMQKKYLKRHMSKHDERNNCKWCQSFFPTQLELKDHKCLAPAYVCDQCNKRFVHKAHLNRHIKLHNNPVPIKKTTRNRKLGEKPVICEKCGGIFKNPYSLKQHLRSHGERIYECDVCNRKFHRLSVLKQHKTVHQNSQVLCNICGKKLKSKKALDIHMLLHGNKKYQCENCDKSFFQKCNYLKHYKQIHGEKVIHKCPHCPTQFMSKSSLDKHVVNHSESAKHLCNLCSKAFYKEYQLKRHKQNSHSDVVYRCPFCQTVARHKPSIRRHFERQHSDLRENWNKPDFVHQLEEKSPTVSFERQTNNCIIYKSNHIKQLKCVSEIEDAESFLSEKECLNNQCDVNISSNIMEVNCDSSNGQKSALEISQVEGSEEVETAELSFTEVPQLNISESDTQLVESVLGNAYIFGEDGGDIMFYILDSALVTNEY